LLHENIKGKDLAPVIIYIGGGGWTVGYRMWALMMEKVRLSLSLSVSPSLSLTARFFSKNNYLA